MIATSGIARLRLGGLYMRSRRGELPLVVLMVVRGGLLRLVQKWYDVLLFA